VLILTARAGVANSIKRRVSRERLRSRIWINPVLWIQ
jgi:hypothetical protein